MTDTGGTGSYSHEDAAHIERSIDETRREIDRTLSELQLRLSVRRRMSAALDRMTPVEAAAVAAGVLAAGWLLVRGLTGNSRSH